MTKIKLKYINEYIDRHGKLRRYFRKGSQRGPLSGDPGSPEFNKAYEAYLSGTKTEPEPETISSRDGSFGRLISGFYNSREYRDIKPSSRRVYRAALEPLVREYGDETAQICPKDAAALIASIGLRKPGMANLTKSVLRRVFDFAIRDGWRDDNPFVSIKPFKAGSHHTWSEGELKQFEQYWPLGTRQRLAYALLLYTGQRVGDVARMRRSDIVDGELHVIQEKTGIELYLPIVPELEQAMRAYPAKGLTLIGSENGSPLTSNALSKFMKLAIEKAGLAGRCKPHGLRKATMRRLAEDGKSVKQMAAVSGHKSLHELQKYIEAADQRELAKAALKKKS